MKERNYFYRSLVKTIVNQLSKNWRKTELKGKIFFIFLVIAVTVISTWIYKIVHDQTPYIDKWTRPMVESFPGTPIYTFSRVITDLGSNPVIYFITVIGATVLLFIYRTWLPSVVYGLGVPVTHFVNRIIKELVGRERPSVLAEVNAVGESFPSTHATLSFVCYGLLAYLLCEKVNSYKVRMSIQILTTLLVLLIGISRYIINVHFLTDVLTGFVFGFICFMGFVYLYQTLKVKIAHNKKDGIKSIHP